MNTAEEMQRELQAEKSRDADLIDGGVFEWFLTRTAKGLEVEQLDAMIDHLTWVRQEKLRGESHPYLTGLPDYLEKLPF